jgi:hypothetical protein
MIGCQEKTGPTYHLGMGGMRSPVSTPPLFCPGGFPPWWGRDKRFWSERAEQKPGWKRPVAEA